MSAASALARGRTAAEALMVDACTITRVTRTTTLPSGEVVHDTEQVYAGRCRVQDAGQLGPSATTDTVADAHPRQLGWTLQVPTSATGITLGDVVAVTASAHDPELVGRTWRVLDVHHKTHATSRRLGIEEST